VCKQKPIANRQAKTRATHNPIASAQVSTR
jgi:hypothetical protein